MREAPARSRGDGDGGKHGDGAPQGQAMAKQLGGLGHEGREEQRSCRPEISAIGGALAAFARAAAAGCEAPPSCPRHTERPRPPAMLEWAGMEGETEPELVPCVT